MLQLQQAYYQKLLEVNGFFTTPFIQADKADKIKEIYHTYFSGEKETFYSSSFHEDIALKKKVSTEVLALLQSELETYFKDYKLLGCSFLKKNANDNNPLPLHQDWTVTDEDKYGSFSIWIPLQDTNQHNGAIRVIEGSHLLEHNFRAPSLPVAFEKDRSQLEKYLKTLPMKKGEAFIFNQKLMHASWPNGSSEERLALTIGLVPKEAALSMLYYDKQQRQLSKYAMPDDMFLRYPEIIQQPTIGTLQETINYTPSVFTEEDFKRKQYENNLKYSTMQPLFTNKQHQDFFEENGFVKIQALETPEIEELRSFLDHSGIRKITDYGFYVGMDHEDKALVSAMMEKIAAVALPKIEPYLQGFQLITASYVIKDINPKGVVPPHQDWTFVEDEKQHCSVTCWIPLVDTNMQNGCLGVIKGSHKIFNSVRPSPSPQVPSPLAKHMFSLFPYFELIPMKAGEALIFDNRTFHASPPNISEAARLAVGLSFTQKEAQLRHYYLKPGTKDTLLKYRVTPEFFKQYDNGSLSKLYDAGKTIEGFELMEEVAYHWDDFSKDEMKQKILSAGNTYNAELTKHMTMLFGAQMKDSMKEKVKGLLAAFHPFNIARKIKETITA